MDQTVLSTELCAYTRLVTCHILKEDKSCYFLDGVEVKSGIGGPGNHRKTTGTLVVEGYSKFTVVVDCSAWFLHHQRRQSDQYDPDHEYDDIEASLFFDKQLVTTLVTNGKGGLAHLVFDGEALQERNYKPFLMNVQRAKSKGREINLEHVCKPEVIDIKLKRCRCKEIIYNHILPERSRMCEKYDVEELNVDIRPQDSRWHYQMFRIYCALNPEHVATAYPYQATESAEHPILAKRDIVPKPPGRFSIGDPHGIYQSGPEPCMLDVLTQLWKPDDPVSVPTTPCPSSPSFPFPSPSPCPPGRLMSLPMTPAPTCPNGSQPSSQSQQSAAFWSGSMPSSQASSSAIPSQVSQVFGEATREEPKRKKTKYRGSMLRDDLQEILDRQQRNPWNSESTTDNTSLNFFSNRLPGPNASERQEEASVNSDAIQECRNLVTEKEAAEDARAWQEILAAQGRSTFAKKSEVGASCLIAQKDVQQPEPNVPESCSIALADSVPGLEAQERVPYAHRSTVPIVTEKEPAQGETAKGTSRASSPLTAVESESGNALSLALQAADLDCLRRCETHANDEGNTQRKGTPPRCTSTTPVAQADAVSIADVVQQKADAPGPNLSPGLVCASPPSLFKEPPATTRNKAHIESIINHDSDPSPTQSEPITMLSPRPSTRIVTPSEPSKAIEPPTDTPIQIQSPTVGSQRDDVLVYPTESCWSSGQPVAAWVEEARGQKRLSMDDNGSSRKKQKVQKVVKRMPPNDPAESSMLENEPNAAILTVNAPRTVGKETEPMENSTKPQTPVTTPDDKQGSDDHSFEILPSAPHDFKGKSKTRENMPQGETTRPPIVSLRIKIPEGYTGISTGEKAISPSRPPMSNFRRMVQAGLPMGTPEADMAEPTPEVLSGALDQVRAGEHLTPRIRLRLGKGKETGEAAGRTKAKAKRRPAAETDRKERDTNGTSEVDRVGKGISTGWARLTSTQFRINTGMLEAGRSSELGQRQGRTGDGKFTTGNERIGERESSGARI